MKVLAILVSVMFLTVAGSSYVFAMCGSCGVSSAQAVEKAVMANNKYCPVTEQAIEKGHEKDFTYEYNGKIYSFCCAGCLKPFKADPDKYIKALEEKQK